MSRIVLSLVAVLALSSCQEKATPQDVLKYEEQEKELEALEEKLDELRAKIASTKNDPPEISVADLQKQLEEKEAALTKLYEDQAGLEKAAKEAKERLEEYQSKYRIPE